MHRRTAVNRRAKVGSPVLCHPFTAVRLCVCSPFAILLALQGAVAQLGEHLVCNQGVRGSNPLRSTGYPTPGWEQRTAPGTRGGSVRPRRGQLPPNLTAREVTWPRV